MYILKVIPKNLRSIKKKKKKKRKKKKKKKNAYHMLNAHLSRMNAPAARVFIIYAWA